MTCDVLASMNAMAKANMPVEVLIAKVPSLAVRLDYSVDVK